ncbi:MAG: type II toxin-antitoxin system VapC family toxin [Solirubrobacterales bacterium]
MKLVVAEPESDQLREHLADPAGEAVTSALSVIEVSRAVGRSALGPAAPARTEAVLAAVDLREIDSDVVAAAARLEPADVRSLDAIHLATALELADELDELVTYDRRLADAARTHGLRAVAP